MGLEEKVLSQVDEEYTVDLLKRLIRIPSVFPPQGKDAMREIASLIKSEMERHDLSVLEAGDEGDTWVRPNLVGTLAGEVGSPVLLLDAHTDVVPVYDRGKWTYDPFGAEVVDGKIYGRGAADTKGSLAAMMAAVFAVARSGLRLKGTVRLVAWAGDEWHPPESPYFNGMTYLARNGLVKGDMAIFGEPYDLKITYTSRGRVWIKFLVGGEATHSATGKGINAIRKAAALIEDIYSVPLGVHPVMGKDSINVGTIRGGNQPNMVPDWCEFHFDIRFAPPLSVEEVYERVAARVRRRQEQDPEFILKSMKITEKREPLEFPPDSDLCQALKRAGKAIGVDLQLGGAVSFGDVADWKDQVGIKAACLFGPGETKQAHAVDEHIRIADLLTAAKVYALTIAYLCGGQG